MVGTIALLFAQKEPLALVKWAFLAFLIHFLICGAFIASLYGWAHAAAAPGAAAATREGLDSFLAGLSDPNSPIIQQDIAIYTGSFGGIVRHHLTGFVGDWLWTCLFTGLDTLGFMLLGMAMLKGGFLIGRWPVEQYRQTARHCFLIGLVPMIGLTIWVVASGFAPLTAFSTALLWSFPFRIPLAVGWAALILWLLARHRDHWLVGRIAATGRMALSNYLGTSLVMTAIFYGWGLGLFGQVRPAAFPLFLIAAWAVMLLWSKPWLDRFAMGPAEWVWRSLQRGKLQKIRRSA